MKGIKTGIGVSAYRRIGERTWSSFRKARSVYPESILIFSTSGKGSLSQRRGDTEEIKSDMGEDMFKKELRCAPGKFAVVMLILGICMSVGCEKPEQQPNKEQVTKKVLETLFPEETRPSLEKFAYGGKDFFGKTTDEMISNFGEPLEVKKTPIKNTHAPEQIDTIVDVKFEGLDVRAYRINRDVTPNRELIVNVELTFPWTDPETGLGIGTDREDVYEILGDPDQIEDTLDRYTVNTDGYPPDIYFTYKNDKVAGIKWEYHID